MRTNTAAVVILLVVIGLALAAVMQASRAVQERARAMQAEQDGREKLWKSYGDQARARRASPQAGRRFESLEALKNAALMRPSLQLRNDAIASLALERKMGARGLKIILEDLMLDVMYQLPSQKKVKEFLITREMVENKEIVFALLEKAG